MISELFICSLCGKNLEISKKGEAICPRCAVKPIHEVEIYYYRKVPKDIDNAWPKP